MTGGISDSGTAATFAKKLSLSEAEIPQQLHPKQTRVNSALTQIYLDGSWRFWHAADSWPDAGAMLRLMRLAAPAVLATLVGGRKPESSRRALPPPALDANGDGWEDVGPNVGLRDTDWDKIQRSKIYS